MTNEESIERSYGRLHGNSSAYLLKYRKVALSCTRDKIMKSLYDPLTIPEEFHRECKEQAIGLIKKQGEILEQLL